MMSLGLGMNGMEERILKIVQDVAERFQKVTYIEIGVAEGTTLSAIGSILQKTCYPNGSSNPEKQWRAVGVELPNGYSFNMERTEENALQRGLKLDFVTPNTTVHPPWNAVTVYLKDSQSFLTEQWQEQIHLALIDGCHGKPCVILDFLAIEAFMAPQGIVMFHDFSIEQVGDHQPHCSGGVDVRAACAELGLMSGKRAGWKFADVIVADKAQGGWDMGVFRKDTDA